ncbi:MAG: histidine phosphatase family protein [Cohaesibacteraceae bacterium]|nr:histidine phosphatase family protein [Cohaesibacteraceae bacterium]MBL4876741.1 histidine phosphatase family protein [Cohaesibacteraceae bacterium]
MKHPDLYILRHGETEWNQQGRFQGRKDSALTANGIAQAMKQKALLAKIQKLPKKKYISPLGRTIHTARLALGSDKDFILDNRLQEIDFGEWEGSSREEIKSQIDYSFESGLWNFRSPGGESFKQISDRVQDFLKDMVEPAIIVTHGTTSIVLRGLCMKLNQNEILNLPKDQGCIFHLAEGVETILR